MRDQHPYEPAMWRVADITVGHRFRAFLGDLSGLVASIREVGLLSPPVVSADGVLLCGARRLAAVKELGWREVPVRVDPSASSSLTALLAEQHENEFKLGLLPTEQAALYVELKAVYNADAAAKRGEAGGPPRGQSGLGEDSSPSGAKVLKSRERAAMAITGGLSFQRLEQIHHIQQVADDEALPSPVRLLATAALKEINEGAPADPNYRKVRVAVQLATSSPPPETQRESATEHEIAAMSRQALEIAQARRADEIKAQAARRLAAAPARRHVRSFVWSWRELDGWTRHYDAAEVARDISDADWEMVSRVVADSVAFINQVATERAKATGERDLVAAGWDR